MHGSLKTLVIVIRVRYAFLITGLNHVSLGRYIKKAEIGPENLAFGIGRFRLVFNLESKRSLENTLQQRYLLWSIPEEMHMLAYDCGQSQGS